MSPPVIDSPELFGRVGQRVGSSDPVANASGHATSESVSLGGPVALPGVATAPPTRDEMGLERLRIALGINDTVIRHLFSIGLSLQTTRTMVADPAQARLDATISELDATISELRSVTFELTLGTPGVRDRDLTVGTTRPGTTANR